MDPYVAAHMRDLYGMNPDAPHMAFQFPRLPPMGRRRLMAPTMPERLGSPDGIARAGFALFREDFLERAKGLAMEGGYVPPGYPLSNGRRLLNSLKAENDRLQRENQDLKERLEGMSGEDSEHRL